MLFSTVAEYDAEITVVSATITRILKLGASTGSTVAGNSRDNSEASLSELREYRQELIKEREILKGKIIYIKAGW